MEREVENNFSFALEVLRDSYSKFVIEIPRAIFHDCDRICVNALRAISPNILATLCRWFMDTDVRVRLSVAFGEEQDEL